MAELHPAADLGWYAAYTFPRHEKRVAAQIGGRGVECFLPLYRSARHWQDRDKEIDVPLFPGYVFIRINPRDQSMVLTAPGVVYIVSSRGRPSALDAAEVEMLRQQWPAGARIEPHPFLAVGNRVRIKSGPMAGLEGILVRRKDKFRVVLTVQMLMRSIAAEVDEADLEALP